MTVHVELARSAVPFHRAALELERKQPPAGGQLDSRVLAVGVDHAVEGHGARLEPELCTFKPKLISDDQDIESFFGPLPARPLGCTELWLLVFRNVPLTVPHGAIEKGISDTWLAVPPKRPRIHVETEAVVVQKKAIAREREQ